MTAPNTTNVPAWIDLATPDVTRSARFYEQLLGWRLEATATKMGDYLVATIADREVGGMMPEPDAPAGWTLFVSVDDVDDTVERAVEAGGAVLEPPFDLPDGRAAVIVDPTGAVLGLLSGLTVEHPWMDDEPGRVRWTELMTRDPAAAEAFYAVLFGWKAETDMTSGIAYTTFGSEDQPIAGMMFMPGTVPADAPSYWAIYFSVVDCATAVETAAALGGTVLHPATRVGDERFAVLADPTGATFQLLADA